MLQKHYEYVRATLIESGNDASVRSPFRSRSKHCWRVYLWAKRLSDGISGVDLDVLSMSAIFHDIGYAIAPKQSHDIASSQMFKDYASKNGFSKEFTEKVCECISIHSDKELLRTSEKLSLEQILLMEADLLDEEGALFVCRSHLRSGYERVKSYDDALVQLEYLQKTKNRDIPMVTHKAQMYWLQKRQFVDLFIKELRFDMGV